MPAMPYEPVLTYAFRAKPYCLYERPKSIFADIWKPSRYHGILPRLQVFKTDVYDNILDAATIFGAGDMEELRFMVEMLVERRTMTCQQFQHAVYNATVPDWHESIRACAGGWMTTGDASVKGNIAIEAARVIDAALERVRQYESGKGAEQSDATVS